MSTLLPCSAQRARRIKLTAVWFAAWLAVCLLPGTAAEPGHKLRIVLVGDSTVTDEAGWGLGFKHLLNDKAECINTARGGRSSKSFIHEGLWKKALALKGDYYLIQFGHNDEPGKGTERETDAATTFTSNLCLYVEQTRAMGATPILVTSLVRRSWARGSTNQINSSLAPYVEAAKRVAAEKKVPVVDLHARSKELCEKLGKEGCLAFSPQKIVDGTNSVDTTHLNAKGGDVFARIVADELRKAVPELGRVLCE